MRAELGGLGGVDDGNEVGGLRAWGGKSLMKELGMKLSLQGLKNGAGDWGCGCS